jgi:CheY-like chemotaxis protein
MDDAAQRRLFQAFSQADESTTRRYGGTGLGLAISMQLVQMMGGTIEVQSAPGQGSTFSFTIPVEAGEHEKPFGAPSVDLRATRVLVVDDNAVSREILTHYLAPFGCDIAVARNGTDALSAMQTSVVTGKPYDIVLLDGNMPDLSGSEVARRIKTSLELAALRIIMLTSVDGANDADATLRPMVRAWLTKPVRRQELHNAMSSALAREQRVAAVDTSKGHDTASVHFGARVLLVEDNRVNQVLAKEHLTRLGCKVEVACNGLEAVRACSGSQFDLVLMDCQMPEMDGFDATTRIREIETVRTPIVALTARAMEGDRDRCLAAGMDDYLIKPFKQEQLRAMLHRWLNSDGKAEDDGRVAAS